MNAITTSNTNGLKQQRSFATQGRPLGLDDTPAGTRGQFAAVVLMFWVVNVTFFLYYAAKSGWVHLAATVPQ